MSALSEARFTAPSEECPQPERWHSVDDESTEVEVTELVAAFVRALQPDLVVETGAGFGQTSKAIGLALSQNGQGHLIASETNPDRAALAGERCAGLPITVLNQESLTVIPPGPVGFAWFDSLLDLRVAEARYYHAWLRPGAVVGFHDCSEFHGLRPAVEALAEEHWIRFISLPTPRGVMFGEVLA